jgi:hypothetical protein
VEIINDNAYIFPDGSLAITVLGDSVGQAIYWYVVSHDPTGGQPDGTPKGRLKWSTTFTGKDKRSVNYYISPPLGVNVIRYGAKRLFGDGLGYGQEQTMVVGDCERVFVRVGNA